MPNYETHTARSKASYCTNGSLQMPLSWCKSSGIWFCIVGLQFPNISKEYSKAVNGDCLTLQGAGTTSLQNVQNKLISQKIWTLSNNAILTHILGTVHHCNFLKPCLYSTSVPFLRRQNKATYPTVFQSTSRQLAQATFIYFKLYIVPINCVHKNRTQWVFFRVFLKVCIPLTVKPCQYANNTATNNQHSAVSTCNCDHKCNKIQSQQAYRTGLHALPVSSAGM